MNVKAWLIPILASDRGLLSALGGPGRLVYGNPCVPPMLPFVAYRETGHRDSQFSIEGAWGTEVTFSFDLYDCVSTAGLEAALDAAMRGVGFYRVAGRDVPGSEGSWVRRRLGYMRVLSDREVA